MDETREQQAHRTHWLWLLLIGALLLVAVPAGAFLLLYRQVRPVTVWELSGDCPPASALMKGPGEASYAFDTGRIDWTHPEDAVVLVAGSDGPRIALVRVEDTTAPTARGVSLVLGVDEEVGPDAFITDLADRQLVGVSFEQAPEFHVAGEWPVCVRLEDLSGNVGFVTTSCTILGAMPRFDIEAGEPVPPLEAFLPNDTLSGRFATDVSALDTSSPGVYLVQVEARGEIYETALVVTDTVPPVCTFAAIAYARPGQPLSPESLVTSAEDVSALSYSFEGAPDWNRQGYQDVCVAVTDAGGNRTSGTVTVLISQLQPLVWEASQGRVSALTVAARQRELDDGFSGDIVMDHFVPQTPGCYDVNALVDGAACIQRLFVVDTVAPRLSFPKKLQAYVDHPQAPEALLAVAEDQTAMTFSYTAEPDWSREGQQSVAVAAVDAGGNRTEVESVIELVRDTERPKIMGLKDQYVYIGEAVAYFAQVWVTDNADAPEDVTLTVDNSAVDIYTPGTYPVIYRATDRAGNTTQKAVCLSFVRAAVSDEKLGAKADEVLAKLVTDDMTQGQKAYAIYRYIFDTYTYSERTSNRRDWKREAWRGLTTRRGDCFTFCAAARILLEKIGAKAMFVARDSKTPHTWLMVDLGTGWYHFDPLNQGPSRKFQCFMFTTEEVRELYPFFWKYDHKIYPETPTTSFKWDW